MSIRILWKYHKNIENDAGELQSEKMVGKRAPHGTKRDQKIAKGSQKGAKGSQKGCKGSQKEAKERPNCIKKSIFGKGYVKY